MGIVQDWIAELKRIAELRDMGILTEEEFLVEKAQIMGSRAQMRSSQEAPMHDENELEKSQASDSMNSSVLLQK